MGADVCVGVGVSAGAWVAAGCASVVGSVVGNETLPAAGSAGTGVSTGGAICSSPQAAKDRRIITTTTRARSSYPSSATPCLAGIPHGHCFLSAHSLPDKSECQRTRERILGHKLC